MEKRNGAQIFLPFPSASLNQLCFAVDNRRMKKAGVWEFLAGGFDT